jgi:extradiol dioxygenase family protein
MASFHYAFKVKDIESTRNFYVDILGCKEGRSETTWIDFDFFDNQLDPQLMIDGMIRVADEDNSLFRNVIPEAIIPWIKAI